MTNQQQRVKEFKTEYKAIFKKIFPTLEQASAIAEQMGERLKLKGLGGISVYATQIKPCLGWHLLLSTSKFFNVSTS
tara:strand:+ start:1776 stop:2006 length:231 start_codon:yes stop_codon:yes gene_type:complete